MISDKTFKLKIKMIPPGLEPGTLRVLGARDNHYTTESMAVLPTIVVSCTTEQKVLTIWYHMNANLMGKVKNMFPPGLEPRTLRV